MQKTIASFECGDKIPNGFIGVFNRGVDLIAKEFDTEIQYQLTHHPGIKIELHLVNLHQQTWFSDVSTREIITYKLSTHLQICLTHFMPGAS